MHAEYYAGFCNGDWASEDKSQCLCRGTGWALSDVDTWHKCPIHYNGQTHPEDYDCLDGASEEDLKALEFKPSPLPLPIDGDLPF